MFRYICLALTLAFSMQAEAQETTNPSDQKALRELEESVTELKKQVHKSKEQIQLLEEAVLKGKIVGSKALVTFENRAEGFFTLSSAEFFLDDELIHKTTTAEGKKPVDEMKIYDQDLPPGEHTLTAKIEFRGSDKSVYRMFSYFKDHKFRVNTTEKVPVEYGKTTVVKVVALDKGYFKESAQERLYLQVQVLRDWGQEPLD